MSSPPIHAEKERLVIELLQRGGLTRDQISATTGVGAGTVSKIKAALGSFATGSRPEFPSDKKLGEFNWREAIPWINEGQQMRKRASRSQDHASIVLGDGSSPIILATLSDLHIGSVGADHNLLMELTDEIINTPNLYVALLGDYAEFAVAMRSISEICGQILSPDMQMRFVESWMEEICPKVAWATWDNHGSMRGEKFIGEDVWSRIIGKNVVYHGNIGHTTVSVGGQSYKIASSHKFRGSSMLNPAHACMRYLRMEAPDCEIAMMGDTHVPMATKYREGGSTRAAINTGNLHLKSGYAHRHFSLAEHPYFPCVVLYPDTHNFSPQWSVADAIKLVRGDAAL